MVVIPISRGLVTLIDDADFELVSRHSWSAFPVRQQAERYYAQTKIEGRTVRLHRFLVKPPPGLTVDHFNGDGLDNQRVNLRIASHSQNNANKSAVTGSVGFRGVWERRGWFRAVISDFPARRKRYLGTYDTPEEAARAYDRAARARFGPFARLNFPDAIQHEAAA
jgi:hypothetical protein